MVSDTQVIELNNKPVLNYLTNEIILRKKNITIHYTPKVKDIKIVYNIINSINQKLSKKFFILFDILYSPNKDIYLKVSELEKFSKIFKNAKIKNIKFNYTHSDFNKFKDIISNNLINNKFDYKTIRFYKLNNTLLVQVLFVFLDKDHDYYHTHPYNITLEHAYSYITAFETLETIESKLKLYHLNSI